ncbi:hypothetical protein C8Q78DRAFT_1181142 [Trametes maxima]|nr:hypothetical protein C8Q78DRAFT_1181142 [Trametes maxima]
MNNGDRSTTYSYPTGEVVPFAANSVVTPEDYQTNLERIQQVKAALAFYEEQNNQGLHRFYEEKQALEAAVEQGRLAAQRLAQIGGQPAVTFLPTPQAPIAGPSSAPLATFPPQYHAGGGTYDATEMPTSARIVELSSPQVDRPATTSSSSAHAEHPINTQRHQNSAQQPRTAHFQQPVNNIGGVANHSNGPSWGVFSSAPAPGTYQQPYQAHRTLDNPINPHSGTSQASQHTLPSAQPSFTAHAGQSVTQRPPPPRPPPPLTQQPLPGLPSGVMPVQPSAPKAPHQPRYGTSTVSSLAGALGSGSDTTSESVPHAKVTYSSRHGAISQAAAPAPPLPQMPTRSTIDPKEEHQLFEFFKRLSPATVKQLMLQVLLIVERKQNGRAKTAYEEQASKTLNQNMLNACEVISERLKNQPLPEVNRLFIKFFELLTAGRELAKTLDTHGPTQTEQSAPISATPAPTVHPPTTVTSQAASFVKPPPQTPATSSQSTDRPPTQTANSLPTQPTLFSSGAAPRKMFAPQILQPTWIMPQDPKAPMAYRDRNGHIRYVFPPEDAPGSRAAPHSNQPSTISSSKAPIETQGSHTRPSTVLEPPGTPEAVDVRPASPWSPEKADRRRLAQDIMRSLGRPIGAFGEPLASASATPSETRDAQVVQNGKRRPSASPGTSTPSKKPRVVEEEVSGSTPAATLVPSSVIDLTSSTSDEEVAEPMRTYPDLPSEPAAPDPHSEPAPLDSHSEPAPLDSHSEPAPPVTQALKQQPEEPEETTTVIPAVERPQSVDPSEVADTERVQEMLPEVPPPESVASGPPSSAKSSSPPPDVPDVVDLPSVDEHLIAMDVSETLDAPPVTSIAPEPEPETEKTVSPSQARDKVPLFLPSPSSSPGASGSAHGGESAAPQAEDVLSDGGLAPRALYGLKGKGRATQFDVDIDLTTPPRSPPRSPGRKSRSAVFVDVPPLPPYAQNLTEARSRSTGASSSASANASGGEESVDELAEWHEEEGRRAQEEEMREAAQVSYERMRESPCQWVGCGAVLNSMVALQNHAALHASDNEEWGTYACRWQNCSHRFSDETKLAQHVQKHARVPLHCAYEGCEKTFNTTEALLAHHRRSKHRGGTLRRTPAPFTPAGHSRALPPLPDVLPAYMSVPRRISRHPISKERHQWLGPKVLENITAFKYSGGRSHAGVPSRGSRRLAEKVAAAELAGVTPEAALEQIRRWIDDEYLAFADGYDAARRPGLRCTDIPSQEVTQLVDQGLVLWPGEDDQKEARSASAPASASGGPEEREGRGAGERRGEDADNDAGPGSGDERSERAAASAPASEDQRAGPGVVDGEDQPMDDVGDGGDATAGDEDAPADAEGDAGGTGLELPRRSHVSVDAHETAPVPGQGGPEDGSASVDVDASPDLGGGEGATEPVLWPVWPPGAPPLLPPPITRHGPLRPLNPSSPHAPPTPPPRPHRPRRRPPPAMQSLPSPGYISARSAEVILSDVRPIKLKPEALHSVNVLLDEFLYSILSASRALATDKLKAALLKVLPTSLGKEALLEAEVELKAYWERTTSPRSPLSARNADASQFDLQWSFELLRLKCEAYSTMNDSDEDAEAEKRLQQRMEATGSSSPPNPSLLAPAALYLTAILEYVHTSVSHVLSNVSRVAARDSGRTLATIQDLFTALCEDDALYGTLRTMKVYEQIESLSKAQRPRRSKSFNRSTDKAMPRTSTSSPTPSKARMSTDSTKSMTTAVGSPESRRTSVEKAKAVKIFHNRSLSDRGRDEPANAGALARSQSEMGINREYPEFEASSPSNLSLEDEELQQEFDELMRSGATMKVSLTPDRLKSMEVYKQERTERERVNRRAGQGSEKAPDSGAPTGEPKRGVNGRPPLRHVDSIIEDDEESGSPTAPALQSNAASARMRNTSFTASPSPTMVRANDQRLRSISISNVPHPRHDDGISRKTSTRPAGKAGSQNAMPLPLGHPGAPQRTRKVGRNRESLDLDDVMNGSDGEDTAAGGSPPPPPPVSPPPTRTPTTPRSPEAMSPRTGKPHISRAAQDLIAFLEAGPPEEPAYNPSMNASVISFESSKTRSGRLQRMMSRLTLGGSKESLNGSIPEEATPRQRTVSRKNSGKVGMSSPPPSFKASSLTSKRSIPDVVNAQPYPNVIVATPPPRPVLQTAASILAEPPSTTSSSHTSREDVSSQAPSLTRRSTRKAVPVFEDSVVSPSTSITRDEARSPVNGHRSSARDPDGGSITSPTTVRKPAQANGHPVKIDTSEASLHPRSITSPSSAIDRKSPRSHSKAESGYASRSASRSPVTPSENLPTPGPPTPAIPTSDVDDLRRLMGAATNADECRLLVDMFLAKNGLAPKTPAVADPEAKTSLDDALALATAGSDEVERGWRIENGVVVKALQSPRGSLSLPVAFPSTLPLPLQARMSLSPEAGTPFGSGMLPRVSLDPHVVSLYRIYLRGLGLLDSST